ncbi:HRDC domain-containing protein [Deinococcus maricopensis]|uniref:HRDC domain protein n=1 Tax=Deinococcus maricopensis (strain DSM 21211 / LMG 22137 / NRRL B-23946 / LB-34) TaxID=709986 RepID=E8U2Y0_DEIML|nr:HRDC domain-containing protein [Deinococcus maricopensis]ADV65718.1 HRDC domain protein [Deinococcus maricopensis DSM 21211]
MIEHLTGQLAGVHAATGDALTRLTGALCALEGAEWALTLADVRALARQLVARYGKGLVRVDPRVPVNRDLLAVHGLAVATTDADWRGANAVWLLNPDEKTLKRARKAEVPIIVDATFAPGGGWLARGADLVVYRDAVTLTGFADATFGTLLGTGDAPEHVAPGASDLAVALALRDVATLPLRAARQADTAAAVLAALPGRAQGVAGGTLLLAPEGLPADHAAWDAPLGGVRPAALSVPAGTLLSVGLEDASALLAALGLTREERGADAPAEPAADAPEPRPAPEIVYSGSIPYPDEAEDAAESAAPELAEAQEPEPEAPAPEPEVHIHDLHPDLPTPDAGADAVADLTDEQRAVFMRLREWRNAEAKRQEVSRFIIASNATLAEIARRAPQTTAELREVRGMGPQRLQKYGEQIIRVVWGI